MFLAQLSDFHLSSAQPERLDRLEQTLDLLLTLDPAPACLLITGDVADRGEPAMYVQAARQLARLPMPVFVVPGNRDWTEPFSQSLAPWCGKPLNGFLNLSGEAGPLRLIGLDSRRLGSQLGQFSAQSQAWLEACLQQEPDRPTLIFLHHPPFKTKLRNGSIGHQIEHVEAFEECLRRHPQVVHVACGHLHGIYAAPVAGILATSALSVAYQGIVEHRHGDEGMDLRPVITLHYWRDGRLISRLG